MKGAQTQTRFPAVRYRLIGLLVIYVFLISPPSHLSRWQQIVERGYLNWGTRPSLLTYFETSDKVTGIEYLLIKKLTDQANIKLNTFVFSNNNDMFDALHKHKLDIIGGYLSITPQRREKYAFSAAFDQTSMQLIVNSSLRNIDNLETLKSKKGEILTPSSYSDFFYSMPDNQAWNVTLNDSSSLYEIINKVNDHEIDFTFADSKIYKIYSHFFPHIRTIYNLSQKNDIVFIGNKTRDKSLYKAMNEIINSASEDGLLRRLYTDIEYGLPTVAATDTVTFIDHYDRLWPQVSDLVYEVAQKYQMDPMLLGAISYQESHWKPDAISFTGVEGLMMLTRRSAKELGISDRTNPRQSLEGGTKYFLSLKERLPKRIKEPDRTYLALVAYNIGYGNMEQARILTQQGGKNPDLWHEVNVFLPFLNDKKLSKQLKWGNADGKTAVDYVNNIITYKNLLQWKEQKTQKTGP